MEYNSAGLSDRALLDGRGFAAVNTLFRRKSGRFRINFDFPNGVANSFLSPEAQTKFVWRGTEASQWGFSKRSQGEKYIPPRLRGTAGLDP